MTTTATTQRITVGGMVNMHDHLRSFLAPSSASDALGLAEVVARAGAAQAAAEPADVRALTALAAGRQLLAGTTTTIDHVYPAHREGILPAVIAGHRSVGLRGLVALGIQTVGLPELCAPVDRIAELARAAADDLLPREALYLAPVSLRQNRLTDYREAAEHARRLGVGLYTHIAENPAEVEQCLSATGRRPVEFLYEQGFLGPRTVVVHAICLTDQEISLLAETGTTVVYCPTNHARLAKPVARVVDLLAARVRVTLGVDGTESLWHEMRAATAAQGQAAGRPGVLPTAQAWRLATEAPREALLENGFEEGFDAGDEVVVDASTVCQPLADPQWALVHRVTPREVVDVTVAGRAAVREGRLVQADLQELVRAACEATNRIALRSGRSTLRSPSGSGS